MIRASTEAPQGTPDGETVGDQKVQDALARILQLETTKLQVNQIAEEEKQNFIKRANEINEGVEKEYKINMDRTLKELEEVGKRVSFFGAFFIFFPFS